MGPEMGDKVTVNQQIGALRHSGTAPVISGASLATWLEHYRDLAVAVDRMRDGWSNTDAVGRDGLWAEVMLRAEIASEEVYPL